MLGESKFALRHRLHELIRIFAQSFGHALRFYRTESLELIEERHFLDLFLGIFFDLGFFACNLGLVNFGFAFNREISARAHR